MDAIEGQWTSMPCILPNVHGMKPTGQKGANTKMLFGPSRSKLAAQALETANLLNKTVDTLSQLASNQQTHVSQTKQIATDQRSRLNKLSDRLDGVERTYDSLDGYVQEQAARITDLQIKVDALEQRPVDHSRDEAFGQHHDDRDDKVVV
jgi:hypothetical protein